MWFYIFYIVLMLISQAILAVAFNSIIDQEIETLRFECLRGDGEYTESSANSFVNHNDTGTNHNSTVGPTRSFGRRSSGRRSADPDVDFPIM